MGGWTVKTKLYLGSAGRRDDRGGLRFARVLQVLIVAAGRVSGWGGGEYQARGWGGGVESLHQLEDSQLGRWV